MVAPHGHSAHTWPSAVPVSSFPQRRCSSKKATKASTSRLISRAASRRLGLALGPLASPPGNKVAVGYRTIVPFTTRHHGQRDKLAVRLERRLQIKLQKPHC